MDRLEVVLLGTGGPRPDPRRAGPATLLRYGDEVLLFDAGRGCVVQMVKAGVDLAGLTTVFVTHHHFDHIGDLYDVMLSTWMAGRKQPLHIYGPPETERIVDALQTQVYDKDIAWRSNGEPVFGGWKPVVATDVVSGLVCETPRWRVHADYVVHGHGLDFSPAFIKRWICLGYRFEAEDGRVVAFSGDTVDCGGLQRVARGADLLVQCCYAAAAELTTEHFVRLAKHTLACGDTVGRIATSANVRKLVLMHHRPRNDDAMLDTLRHEVETEYRGQLVIGHDLMTIPVEPGAG